MSPGEGGGSKRATLESVFGLRKGRMTGLPTGAPGRCAGVTSGRLRRG
ncbi:hypothetical protein SZ55_5052 [Pseudomonas sp. FeS53a]|nr:hypothetical protein SZ55_5052 [Pseudomonas sp. FeS53a]